MFATKDFKGDPNVIINKYILPLLDDKDLNLIDYRDKKNNNALHLFFKGKMMDEHNFLKVAIYDFIKLDLDFENK